MAGQLEHGRPPTPKQRKKEGQHVSSSVDVPGCLKSAVYSHPGVVKDDLRQNHDICPMQAIFYLLQHGCKIGVLLRSSLLRESGSDPHPGHEFGIWSLERMLVKYEPGPKS